MLSASEGSINEYDGQMLSVSEGSIDEYDGCKVHHLQHVRVLQVHNAHTQQRVCAIWHEHEHPRARANVALISKPDFSEHACA